MDKDHLTLEAEDIIRDVQGMVASIAICTRTVRKSGDKDAQTASGDTLWLNIACLEPNMLFTVELSADGLQIVAREFSTIDDAVVREALRFDSVHGLLDTFSPMYRAAFATSLMSRLAALADAQDERGATS